MPVNTLVYIPTGFASPELEILLAKAQSSIDAGENVTVVTCSGESGYACSLNIFGLRILCRACTSLTNKAVLLLRGNYQRLQTPPLLSDLIVDKLPPNVLKNRWEIKGFSIDKVDIGQAAYSSYIGLSRDQDLEGKLARWSQNKLLRTSETLLRWFQDLLHVQHIRRIVLYNGRHNQYRPLLRAGQRESIHVDILEFSGQDAGCVYIFQNELPQDIDVLNRYIEKKWKAYKGDSVKASDSYYSFKRAGGVINDKKSYVLGQKEGELPEDWDPSMHNIAIFNSSEDEYTALGGDYDKTLYANQTKAIVMICNSLRDDPSIMIWLRIHPNLKNVKWSFAQKLLKLGTQFTNVRVIPGDSPVSSYALLDACNTVLSFGSTMGVEAVYAGKPSILVGRCVYERLGSVYTPQSHDEVISLLRQRNLPSLSLEGAMKVAVFWSEGGVSIPYFAGNRRSGFDFDGIQIKKSLSEAFYYSIGKFTEKFLLGWLLNYCFGNTRKQLKQ